MLTSAILEPEILEKAHRTVREFHELIDLGLINKEGEFVPTLMYLPMTQHPPMTEKEFLKGYVPPRDNKFMVYGHIPFCIQQCAFCHFPNVLGASDGEKDVYLDHMNKEMELYLKKIGVNRMKAHCISVGGGTPTLMTPAQMKRFLSFFTSRVDMGEMKQFSVDLDPLTMLGYEGRERLKIMRDAGVGRLALGAQTLSDDMLKKMGRHHTAADTLRAIGVAKEMGFKLNLELICDYPGETPEHWVEMMKQAVKLDVDEIVVFRLKILPYGINTAAVNKMLNARDNPLMSNDEQVMLKSVSISLLERSGFVETVTRFFARTSEDYSVYLDDWLGETRYDNIGFGYYAMSAFHDRQKQNTWDLKEYCSEVDAGRLPVKIGIVRSRDQQLRRNFMMPLKNRCLLSKKLYQDRMGVSPNAVFSGKIALLKKYDLLEEDADFLRPTKKGRFFIDEMTQLFYHPDYLPFKRECYKDGPLNPYTDNVTLTC